ncbi:MAG: STN domain-containing protein [Steroidobacteraceae bacterium]
MPLFAVFTLIALAGCAWPVSALDLGAQFEFRIAPQKLATALVELSRQANAQVVSDTTEVDRFDSAGISGRMALKEALRTLLEGTDLDYTVTDRGVIAIGMFGPRSTAIDRYSPLVGADSRRQRPIASSLSDRPR